MAHLKQLPGSVDLWSPDDVASFLRLRRCPKASIEKVKASVRLHSFDEVDGPRVLRCGIAGLRDLGLTEPQAEALWAELKLEKPVVAEMRFELDGRCEAFLWGIFIADALAAPAHWYYDPSALAADYGRIGGYVAPKARHSANRIMNNHWKANKHDICTLVEGGHMLHGKAAIWKEPYNHYHSGFQPGENTLNAQVARVLMRCVSAGGYDPGRFLLDYKTFLMTEGSHNDSYCEAFHRQLLANHLLRGLPLDQSAGAENHDTPSIGGFVALLPLLLVASARGCEAALATAERHLALTHKSQRLAANLAVYARALWSVLAGRDLREACAAGARELGWDLAAMELSDHEAVYEVFGPACYIGDSLPVVFYLAHKYAASPAGFRDALLANTNAGGENCHRGAALGALLGAAYGMAGIPQDLLDGLDAREAIRKEVKEFLQRISG